MFLPGPISLCLHSCSQSLQKIRSILCWLDKYSGLVGSAVVRDLCRCRLGFRLDSFLGSLISGHPGPVLHSVCCRSYYNWYVIAPSLLTSYAHFLCSLPVIPRSSSHPKAFTSKPCLLNRGTLDYTWYSLVFPTTDSTNILSPQYKWLIGMGKNKCMDAGSVKLDVRLFKHRCSNTHCGRDDTSWEEAATGH